jgi:hypothetical protein
MMGALIMNAMCPSQIALFRKRIDPSRVFTKTNRTVTGVAAARGLRPQWLSG